MTCDFLTPTLMFDSMIGQPVPGFSAKSTSGYPVSPVDLKGKWVVLYFYPKDDTPGCTKEACGFRDQKKEFEKRDVVVYGVSTDDFASHEKFIKKYDLNFPLLADPDHVLAEAFNVWNGKNADRVTFVVDPEGKVAKVFQKVTPAEHAEDILKYIDVVRNDWAL